MDEDGQKQGYDLGLTRAISEKVNIPVIASGGAGAYEHFLDAFEKVKLMQFLQHHYFILVKYLFLNLKSI